MKPIEVIYSIGAMMDESGKTICLFCSEEFADEDGAESYIARSLHKISRLSFVHVLKYCLVTVKGDEPTIISVREDEHGTPILAACPWLHYSALLPREYLADKNAKPLPWRETLARLHKATRGKGWYEDPTTENDHEH